MSLIKTTNTAIADRLRQNLRTKYGMGSAVLPDTSCLLLDISGSMDEEIGGGRTKISELRKLADEFSQARRFEFSSTCSEIPRGQDVSEPNGGTALHVGLEYVKKRGMTHVVLITDGAPDDAKRAMVAAMGLKVDCFYVGPDEGYGIEFLKKLSDGSGGSYGKASLERLMELKAAVKERLMLSAPERTINL